jgi:hypothetical protein
MWRLGRSSMLSSLKLKMFAGLLLRAMAQEQAENKTKHAFTRHPNVARRLALEPDAPELAIAERYLAQEGYISPCPANGEGSFTITQTGWEELGYQHSAEGWRPRPWWKRMLGV